MPGTALSTTELRLKNWWHNGTGPFPTLRRLQIDGDPGLRGIRSLDVAFEYPLTVIAGRNGSGKTTVLALAALAFHAGPGHIPRGARRTIRTGETSTYYTFSDFFFKGPSDPDITGIQVRWEYGSVPPINQLSVRKESSKWMRYYRRPPRPVQYLGVIRALPAVELSVARSRFSPYLRFDRDAGSLTQDSLQRLGDIMGRSYEGANVMASGRCEIRRCQAGAPYSSFNMGAGEDVLIDLLYVLQTSPPGSLIIVEEIEIGLHPEAVIRLARHIQDIIWDRKLQVIVSSHSTEFIDSVPREARVLVRRAGNDHLVAQQPTTRFAMGIMSGASQPELHVYCEDNFSQLLIEASLAGEILRRTEVIPIGSKSELANQGKFHILAQLPHKVLLVWDGDVTNTEVAAAMTAIREEARCNYRPIPGWAFMPEHQPPEAWVLEQLDCAEGRTSLARELRDEPARATELIERLRALPDIHQAGHVMAQSTNLEPEECLKRLVRAVAALPGRPLAPIGTAISQFLGGADVNGLRLCAGHSVPPAVITATTATIQ